LAIPDLLRNRDFNLYWCGLVASQVGTRATSVANLYQVYTLTRSVPITGLVGLAQGVALLVLSPFGGAYADRVDRRRLLQVTQSVSLGVTLALAALTIAGRVAVWQVLVCVVLITAASTFDAPARQALIPALVPRAQLPQAFSLLNPSRELAFLVGPSAAGLLIAVSGPALVYIVDAGTYGVLVVALAMLRTPRMQSGPRTTSLWAEIRLGAVFLRSRTLILQLMTLDLSATLFAAYRVVLPALALDVLHVGPAGYGLLSSAPSAGAVLATYFVFRVLARSRRLGRVLLLATMGYGVATMLLAQSPHFATALFAAVLMGALDAMATSIRHAAVQLETPDELRGRVSSIYQMASRGGPSLGDVNVGLLAGLLGPVAALTLGGTVPLLYAGVLWARGGRVPRYEGADQEEVQPTPVVEPPDQKPVIPVSEWRPGRQQPGSTSPSSGSPGPG
jgi:MFS family permease